MNPKDGSVAPVIEGESYDGWVSWSPNADRFTFSSNRNGKMETFSAKLDGSDVRLVEGITRTQDPERTGESARNLSRDGRYLAMWTDETGKEPRDYYLEILDLKTGKNIILPKYQMFTALPNISPDGSKVVFAGAIDEGITWRIYVQDVASGAIRQVWPKYPE